MKIIKLYEEYTKTDLKPVSSFKIQDSLQPKIWDGFEMKPEIKRNLMNIAQEYYDTLEIDAEIYDIILTGSLANFNWSKYSDYDLHILIDFNDVNDDVELVKKFVDMSRVIWNDKHNVELEGFEVEVYIQEKDENHTASGIYSLLKDRWLVKPTPAEFEPNEEEIQLKSIDMMKQIDALEDKVNKYLNDESSDYETLKEKSDEVWEKVKRLRKEGLEQGEFGLGNLVFKFLRRNEYIGKLIDLRTKIYDKNLSDLS